MTGVKGPALALFRQSAVYLAAGLARPLSETSAPSGLSLGVKDGR